MEFWDRQRFETRTLGVIEIAVTDERTPLVTFRCWGRPSLTGGVERGENFYSIQARRLAQLVTRELVRGGDLGRCWVDPGQRPAGASDGR